MRKVLYIALAAHHFDGANYSLLDMIESVKHEIEPIVLLPERGCVYDKFQELGIRCIVHDFKTDVCTDPRTIKQWIGYLGRLLPGCIRYKKGNRKCVDWVSNMLRNENIEIVHSNSTILTFGYDIAKALNAKFVWHLRGFMDLDFGWKPILGWRNYRNTIRHSDAVIGITPSVLSHLAGKNPANGYAIFDAVRSKNDTALIQQKQKYFLFCAGKIIPTKGCDIAIKAFYDSGLWRDGYRLRIIGSKEGKYSDQIDEMIRNYGIGEYLDFISFTKDIKSQMANATAFLMCSQNEGLGRVTIESMFYGTLVIARNSGGTVDFVFDKKTGILFNNIKECAEAMKYVAKNDCSEMIRNAQIFAVENFAIEDYGRKILNVYNNIN